jgi:hypothetical protein
MLSIWCFSHQVPAGFDAPLLARSALRWLLGGPALRAAAILLQSGVPMASNQSTSTFEVMARVFWMLVGPGTLSILAISIAENHRGWFAARSIAFLVVLVAVITARWMDPLNSYGEPATPGQRRSYMLFTAFIGLLAWVITNVLGILWLAH